MTFESLGRSRFGSRAPTNIRGDAGILVQQRYSRRGYRVPSPKATPNECMFAAYEDGHLAGTLSVRFDSSDGLAADEIFRAEVDLLRRLGCRICEFIRLAVDASGMSKPVLAGLFHTAYLYAKQLRGFRLGRDRSESEARGVLQEFAGIRRDGQRTGESPRRCTGGSDGHAVRGHRPAFAHARVGRETASSEPVRSRIFADRRGGNTRTTASAARQLGVRGAIAPAHLKFK